MPPTNENNLFQPEQSPESPIAQITAITPTKRDPSRATIKVNRRNVATLPLTTIAQLNLRSDSPWTPETDAQTQAAVQLDKTTQTALAKLNRRQYSRSELRRKLQTLKHPPHTIDQVLDNLTARSLLDDHALGQELIAQLTRTNSAAPKRIQLKLKQRLIPQNVIDDLLQQYAPDPDQLQQAANDFAQNKVRTMARLDPATRHRRLWSQLARRGYDTDTIKQALNTILKPPPDEDPL